MFKLISYAAEAKVYLFNIQKEKLVLKKRISKEYRHKTLDSKILKKRNRKEALILKKLKENNINTPYIYYASKDSLILEYLENTKKHSSMLLKIGKEIAKIHNLDIIHGDLNLVNIITKDNKVYFIDFGLSQTTKKIEDKATDLLVFKKTLKSKKTTEKFWEEIIKGYKETTKNPEIIKQIDKIEKRGRYL